MSEIDFSVLQAFEECLRLKFGQIVKVTATIKATVLDDHHSKDMIQWKQHKDVSIGLELDGVGYLKDVRHNVVMCEHDAFR